MRQKWNFVIRNKWRFFPSARRFFPFDSFISHGIKFSDYGNYFVFIPPNLRFEEFPFLNRHFIKSKCRMCVAQHFIWMCTISTNSFHSQVSPRCSSVHWSKHVYNCQAINCKRQISSELSLLLLNHSRSTISVLNTHDECDVTHAPCAFHRNGCERARRCWKML